MTDEPTPQPATDQTGADRAGSPVDQPETEAHSARCFDPAEQPETEAHSFKAGPAEQPETEAHRRSR